MQTQLHLLQQRLAHHVRLGMLVQLVLLQRLNKRVHLATTALLALWTSDNILNQMVSTVRLE